jgi:hypothetical protein
MYVTESAQGTEGAEGTEGTEGTVGTEGTEGTLLMKVCDRSTLRFPSNFLDGNFLSEVTTMPCQ